MAGFGQMAKGSGRSSGGSNSPAESVVFQVIGYNIKDQRGLSYSPEDYMDAYLFRDACGIVAEFDAQNNPITKVKIALRPDDRANTTAFTRPTMGEFRKGNHMGKPMLENAIGYADRCWLDPKTGMITTSWLNRIYPNFDPDLNYPMFGVMASVRPEGKFTKADGDEFYQNRYVPMTENAVSVKTIDELRAEAIVVLNSLAEGGLPGAHGFVVRGMDLDTLDRNAVEFFVPWDKEAVAPMAAEKAVDQWLASETGQEWASVIEQVAGTNFVLEVMPQVRVNTGQFTMPSKKRETALRENKKVGANIDDSTRYLFQADGEERGQAMYALSDVEIQRAKREDGTYTNWTSTGTRPTANRPPLFAQDELITANLPQDVQEKLTKVAADRAKVLSDRYLSSRAPAAAAADPAPAPEADESGYKM